MLVHSFGLTFLLSLEQVQLETMESEIVVSMMVFYFDTILVLWYWPKKDSKYNLLVVLLGIFRLVVMELTLSTGLPQALPSFVVMGILTVVLSILALLFAYNKARKEKLKALGEV